MRRILLASLLSLSAAQAFAVQPSVDAAPISEPGSKDSKIDWHERISLRGYTQIRYNRLLESNSDLKCQQCDRSWGDGGGFFIRRARIVLSGDVHPNVYVYIQPDFVSDASSTGLHYAQLRDAYFDLALDSKKEFRFRIGQSKIPYGWENLQSSSNRIPLDRHDALNSGVPNERDLGVFFYWAPQTIRKRFRSLITDGLKGSGDYGVVGFGVYNGQTANRPEATNSQHIVGRITYPFVLGDPSDRSAQIFEPGLSAYTGRYSLLDGPSAGVTGEKLYDDRRVATQLILYPKPIGAQIEYTWGRGPEYDPSSNSIRSRALQGGYAMLNARWVYSGPDLGSDAKELFPFVRYHFYRGGKKTEKDARRHLVSELEFGVEWQPIPAFELVMMWTHSRRRFEDSSLRDNTQEGSLLRLQAQFNY